MTVGFCRLSHFKINGDDGVGGGGGGKGIRLLAEDSHYLDTENEFQIKPVEKHVSLNISHQTEEKIHTLHTLYIYMHTCMHSPPNSSPPPPPPPQHTHLDDFRSPEKVTRSLTW